MINITLKDMFGKVCKTITANDNKEAKQLAKEWIGVNEGRTAWIASCNRAFSAYMVQ